MSASVQGGRRRASGGRRRGGAAARGGGAVPAAAAEGLHAVRDHAVVLPLQRDGRPLRVQQPGLQAARRRRDAHGHAQHLQGHRGAEGEQAHRPEVKTAHSGFPKLLMQNLG